MSRSLTPEEMKRLWWDDPPEPHQSEEEKRFFDAVENPQSANEKLKEMMRIYGKFIIGRDLDRERLIDEAVRRVISPEEIRRLKGKKCDAATTACIVATDIRTEFRRLVGER